MTKWTKTGLVGTIITAICCFTPILVWLFTAIGLAGMLAYLDFLLLPLLGLFTVITIWGIVRHSKA